MSTGESFESRFEKIDVTLKDPKSEVNVDCLLVSRERPWAPGHVSPNSLPCGTESCTAGWVTAPLGSAPVFCLPGAGPGVLDVPGERAVPGPAPHLSSPAPRTLPGAVQPAHKGEFASAALLCEHRTSHSFDATSVSNNFFRDWGPVMLWLSAAALTVAYNTINKPFKPLGAGV